MARRRRRQRRRHMGPVLFPLLLVVPLLGFLAGLSVRLLTLPFRRFPLGLLLTPFAIVLAATAVAFWVALVAVAFALLVLLLVLGGPLYLAYVLLRSAVQAETRPWQSDEALEPPASVAPDAVLRRRYVAGELTYQEFQGAMVGLLKERFKRGELAVMEYEAELEHLLRPARHLDVRGDPTIADAQRR
ncbi:MAG: hypothetical protein HY332_20415 [Chloroflexi bacterium]|nr:hypothetical protein [Chloroflexota bacterium]